jgi:hypothetical protein
MGLHRLREQAPESSAKKWRARPTQTDAMIDVLKGIETSPRIRHDPEVGRIVAAFR